MDTDGFLVTNVIITYDAKHTVACCTDVKNQKCAISQYIMKTGELCYTIYVDGSYVVMNEIEQNL
jgi:hypothetical protein